MHADIRPARASDIDALVSIENSVFGTDRISRRALQRHVDSRTATLLVAEDRGSVLGYALVLFRTNGRAGRLYSLAVKRGCEGSGIGRRLLAAAEKAALSRGCPIFRLEVREENVRAIDLYRRAGYRLSGRRQGYYEDGAAALLFEKDLGVEEP